MTDFALYIVIDIIIVYRITGLAKLLLAGFLRKMHFFNTLLYPLTDWFLNLTKRILHINNKKKRK